MNQDDRHENDRSQADSRDTQAGTGDKFATTKQAGNAAAPVMLQLRNASFPIAFGRYHLLRVLGEGAMGGVYLGQDTQLQRDVAIKIPKVDETDRGAIQRFQREARAMATLRHANLCPVYDVGELEGVPYFTMAYIEGETLAKHLEAGKALPGREVALLILKLAQAVEEAHQRGIVHRDLKPSNIIIDHNKEPVIMDFGLARLSEGTSSLTQSGLMIGTPAYMAPEQVRGELDRIGPASDIYSLGAIMYEMLTGRLAFEGSVTTVVKQTLSADPDRPSQIAPGVSPELDAICLKAMSKDPSKRYASGGSMATAVRKYLKHGRAAATKTATPVRQTLADESLPTFAVPPEPAPAVNSLASLRKHRRRQSRRQPRLLWLLAGAGAVGLLLGLLFVVMMYYPSEKPVAQGTSPAPADELRTADSLSQPQDAAEAPSSEMKNAARTLDSTEPFEEPRPQQERTPPPPPDGARGLPGRMPADGRPPGPPPRTAAEIIRDFDQNDDGMLEVVEIPFDQRPHIMRADADRNGIVVEEELDVFLILFRPEPPR